jgi:hypothetical protein
MFELFQSKDQGHAYMCVITENTNFGSSMLQLWPPPSILEPWPPPVNNIIMSSEEEIQPKVWLFKCNQTDGVVPLQVLLCWVLLSDCFSFAQWRYDTVTIRDEVAAFTLIRNYLLGHQLSSLSLES